MLAKLVKLILSIIGAILVLISIPFIIGFVLAMFWLIVSFCVVAFIAGLIYVSITN